MPSDRVYMGRKFTGEGKGVRGKRERPDSSEKWQKETKSWRSLSLKDFCTFIQGQGLACHTCRGDHSASARSPSGRARFAFAWMLTNNT